MTGEGGGKDKLPKVKSLKEEQGGGLGRDKGYYE